MSLNRKRRIFRSSFASTRWLSGLAVALVLAIVLGLTGVTGTAVSDGERVWSWLASWMDDHVGQAGHAGQAEPTGRMVADASLVAVVDGTTLRLADRVVRLDGAIAPVRGQTCLSRDGAAFDCGVAAANALAAMLRQGQVDCTLLGADGDGRSRAVCSAGGEVLNQAVVAQGWARASDDALRPAERRARAEQRGQWAMAR